MCIFHTYTPNASEVQQSWHEVKDAQSHSQIQHTVPQAWECSFYHNFPFYIHTYIRYRYILSIKKLTDKSLTLSLYSSKSPCSSAKFAFQLSNFFIPQKFYILNAWPQLTIYLLYVVQEKKEGSCKIKIVFFSEMHHLKFLLKRARTHSGFFFFQKVPFHQVFHVFQHQSEYQNTQEFQLYRSR